MVKPNRRTGWHTLPARLNEAWRNFQRRMQGRAPVRQSTRPRLEELEDRTVPSGFNNTLVAQDVVEFLQVSDATRDLGVSHIQMAPDQTVWVIGRTGAPGSILNPNGSMNLFAQRLSADGTEVLADVTFGGMGQETIIDVAVAPDGGLAIVGMTTATGLASAGAEQQERRGPQDGFLVRFDADGQVMFSTYLGSASVGAEFISGVAFDADGRVYVSGGIRGNDFFDGPRGEARIEVFGEPNFDFEEIGNTEEENRPVATTFDAFVTRYNDNGSVSFTAIVGGKDFEQVEDIAIASDGSIILVGRKEDPGGAEFEKFPLVNSLDTTPADPDRSGFLVKLASNASALSFSTYLGRVVGPSTANRQVAVDAVGDIYVLGLELATTEPAEPGVVSLPLSKISSAGDAILYTHYFGVRDSLGEIATTGELIRGHLAVAPTGEVSLGFQMFQEQNDGTPADQIQRISHDGERVLVVSDAANVNLLGSVSAFGVGSHTVLLATNLLPMNQSNVRADLHVFGHLLVNSNGDQANAGSDPNVVDVDLDTPGAQITLRAALEFAKQRSGEDTILVDLAGMYDESKGLNSFVVDLTSPLPEIDHRVNVIGHPVGTPLELEFGLGARLTLDGASGSGLRFVGPGANGDELPHPDNSGTGSRFSGLGLRNFSGFGARLDTDNVVLEDFVIQDNSGGGVQITGNGNTIGNSVISGNGGVGVRVTNSHGNSVSGNFIGLTAERDAVLANDGAGVVLDGGRGHYVGFNFIAGNRGNGIEVQDLVDATVELNEVGAQLTTGAIVGNQGVGIRAERIADSILNFNTVIKNQGDGILLLDPTGYNEIFLNHVGIHRSADRTIETAAGNGLVGILLVNGVEQTVFRNTVGDNGNDGIRIEGGSGNYVGGNRVGVGVTLTDETYQIVEMGNAQSGIDLVDTNDNLIGVYSTNDEAVDENLDGIDDETFDFLFRPGADNIVAGNTGAGVHVRGSSTGNRIEANTIGYVTGLENGSQFVAIMPNQVGVLLDNVSSNFVSHNIVSGNSGAGVQIQGINAIGNQVQSNFIGLEGFQDLFAYLPDPNAEGEEEDPLIPQEAFGNGGAGILVREGAHDNTIGGVDYFGKEANRIAFNGDNGIVIEGDTTQNNSLRGNMILFHSGIPIDLGGDGATANDLLDADTGANRLQNAPEIVLVRETEGETIVHGRLMGQPGATYQIDFFARDSLVYFGSLSVQVDGSGAVAFQMPFSSTHVAFDEVLEGLVVTATDSLGNTSEFSVPSNAIVVNVTDDRPDADPEDGVADVDLETEGLQTSLRAAIEEANQRPGEDRILFDIPVADGNIIRVTGEGLPRIAEAVVIDGTNPFGSGAIIIDGLGAGTEVSGLEFDINEGGSTVRNLTVQNFLGHGIESRGEVLHLHSVTIRENDGWGVHARGNVNLGHLQRLAPTVISGNDLGGVLAFGSGGVESSGGAVSLSAAEIIDNGGAGIVARGVVEIFVFAGDEATRISGNGATGITALGLIVRQQGNAAAIEVSNNDGHGIDLYGPIDENSDQPEGARLGGSHVIDGNAGWGIRSLLAVDHKPFDQSTGTTLTVTGNGKAQIVREIDSASINAEVASVEVVRDNQHTWGGIFVRNGAFEAQGVVASNNGGPGVAVFGGNVVLEATAADNVIRVNENNGPGVVTSRALTVRTTLAAPVAEFNNNGGHGIETRGRISESDENSAGLILNGSIEASGNDGWGIVSRHDITEGLGLAREQFVQANGNGQGADLFDVFTVAGRELLFSNVAGDPAAPPGGILSEQGGVTLINLSASDNAGAGVAALRDVVIDIVSRGAGLPVQINHNGGPGIYSEGDVSLRHRGNNTDTPEVMGNAGDGIFADNLTVIGNIDILENAGWGVFVRNDAGIGIAEDQVVTGHSRISENGANPQVVEAVGIEPAILRVRTIDTRDDAPRGGVLSETGTVVLGNVELVANTGQEVEVGAVLDLRQITVAGTVALIATEELRAVVLAMADEATWTAQRVEGLGSPVDDNHAMPFGAVSLTVQTNPGGTATLDFLDLPQHSGATLWKHGPTGENATPHWYEFAFDGSTGGEFLSAGTLRLHLRDGGRGDNDGTANGTILDPIAITYPLAPKLTASESVNGVEGGAAVIAGSWEDFDTSDPATLQGTVDFGDGTTAAVEMRADHTFTVNHTYVESGVYTATLTLTDTDGRSTQLQVQAVIGNLAPTANITGPNTAAAGEAVTFTLTANDASPVDQAAGFTFRIDWNGDGTVDQVVTGPNGMQVNHTFGEEGSFDITVVAVDRDGGTSADIVHAITVAPNPGGGTGSAVLSNGTLTISGTGNNDIISVRQDRNGALVVHINEQRFGPFVGVARIVADGLAGDDEITVASAVSQDATLSGGTGHDTLRGGAGNDHLLGGEGDDELRATRGNDTLEGGAGNDKLWAGDGEDLLLGGDGNDELRAAQGADLLDGGAGNDSLWGGLGNDTLFGGTGDDLLRTGQGDDYLAGGEGNDTIHGGQGRDTLLGGSGEDHLFGGSGGNRMDGGEGNDFLRGGNGEDTLLGGAGNDTLLGGAGNDLLQGGSGDDVLQGGAGRDLLFGGAGADRLEGDAGDDLLIAGQVVFADDAVAMSLVMAEWTSQRSYAARVANLHGDGSGERANDAVFLRVAGEEASVVDDEAIDTVQGDGGQDWVFASRSTGTRDLLPDLRGNELVEDLGVL